MLVIEIKASGENTLFLTVLLPSPFVAGEICAAVAALLICLTQECVKHTGGNPRCVALGQMVSISCSATYFTIYPCLVKKSNFRKKLEQEERNVYKIGF